ncbi:MAG: dTMP kinase, partial [Nanoarchaeota archaeon]
SFLVFMSKGIFIVLDGMDGSGKSEMVNLLGRYISSNDKNCNVLATREPSEGVYGKEIRDILAQEEDPKINGKRLLELFIKDREDHLKKEVVPFLNKTDKGKNIVICDRYYYSTIAFQATQGLDIKMLIEVNKGFLKPDLALILNIKPEIALERIKTRKKEKFEKLEFMKKLRKRFLEMPKLLNDNIKVIDASKSKEEVFEDIRQEVEKAF